MSKWMHVMNACGAAAQVLAAACQHLHLGHSSRHHVPATLTLMAAHQIEAIYVSQAERPVGLDGEVGGRQQPVCAHQLHVDIQVAPADTELLMFLPWQRWDRSIWLHGLDEIMHGRQQPARAHQLSGQQSASLCSRACQCAHICLATCVRSSVSHHTIYRCAQRGHAQWLSSSHSVAILPWQ